MPDSRNIGNVYLSKGGAGDILSTVIFLSTSPATRFDCVANAIDAVGRRRLRLEGHPTFFHHPARSHICHLRNADDTLQSKVEADFKRDSRYLGRKATTPGVGFDRIAYFDFTFLARRPEDATMPYNSGFSVAEYPKPEADLLPVLHPADVTLAGFLFGLHSSKKPTLNADVAIRLDDVVKIVLLDAAACQVLRLYDGRGISLHVGLVF